MHSLIKLVKIIKSSHRIIIATHVDPDCDGISAALACAYLVKHYKKRKPILYCYSPIPPKYQFLLGDWEFTRRISNFDVLITVDSAGISRVFPNLDNAMSEKIGSKIIINIDHHRCNDPFGELQIVDEKASSSCEIP